MGYFRFSLIISNNIVHIWNYKKIFIIIHTNPSIPPSKTLSLISYSEKTKQIVIKLTMKTVNLTYLNLTIDIHEIDQFLENDPLNEILLT